MEAVQQAKEATATDLGWLLDESDDAVVTLVAGETRLVAHRAVLTDRSPVFKAMFRHRTLEASSGSVNILDVEGPVLRQLVGYLYCLQAPQLPGTAHKLLAAADQYGLPGLKEACERQVAAQMTVETAAAAAVLAIRHGCDGLRTAAIHFIRSHLAEVMTTRGWADAVRTHPEDVVEMGRLLSAISTAAPADSGTSATAAPRPLGDHRDRQTPASAAPPTAAAHHGSPPDEAADSRVSTPASVFRGTSATAAAAPQPFGNYSGCRHTSASAKPATATAHHGSQHAEAAYSRVSTPAAVDSGTFPTPATLPFSEHSDCSQTPASGVPPTPAAHHGSPQDVAANYRMSTPASVFSGTSATAAAAPQPFGDHSGCRHTSASAKPATATAHHGSPHAEAAYSRVRWLSAEEINERLVEAAKQGAPGELEALLAAGADVAAREEVYGGTALHWAAKGGRVEVAKWLLAAGAPVDARDTDRWQGTPLHWAAYWGHAAVARLLLAAGADPGARAANGRTPLHWAAYWGHAAAAAVLLAAGADGAARDRWGETPLDDARSRGHQRVEELLQAAARTSHK